MAHYPEEDVFFNIEMEVDSYPEESERDALKTFLNLSTAEIVDDVVFLMDGLSGEILWELDE
jgi:hypothetical protein